MLELSVDRVDPLEGKAWLHKSSEMFSRVNFESLDEVVSPGLSESSSAKNHFSSSSYAYCIALLSSSWSADREKKMVSTKRVGNRPMLTIVMSKVLLICANCKNGRFKSNQIFNGI